MPRPIKRRIICSEPKINIFGPPNYNRYQYINMNLEEYETIRLIDYKNLTQEECAELMGVARTTIQKIYDDARKKIADAIVNGKTIKIEGGNYTLCSSLPMGRYCNKTNCGRFGRIRKHRNYLEGNNEI
ncbi:MAG: DUF134 domain-containing protein [Bacilli bacterium]